MAGFLSLASAGIGLAGSLASKFLPGVTSGSGGTYGSTSGTTTNHGTVQTSYDPQFSAATSALIDQAGINAARPYQTYPTSQAVAGFDPTQLDAFWHVKNAPTWSAPYMDAGQGYFGQAGKYNASTAAQPFLDQGTGFLTQGQGFLNRAQNAIGGYDAAKPYADQATGTFTGDNVKKYMDPYLDYALGAQNRIANQNLTSSVLPALNSQFIGAGGGARAGNNAYSSEMNDVIGRWSDSLFNSNALMTNDAYKTAGSNFQADKSRYGTLANTMGTLANNTLGAYGSLANNAWGGANSAFTGAGTAAQAASATNRDFANLGSSMTNAGKTANDIGAANTSALLAVGNQQQDLQQKANDFALSEKKAADDYPFATSKYFADIMKGVRVPTTVTSDSTSTTSGTTAGSSSSTPSLLGTGIGIAAGAKGVLSGIDWSKIFGGNAGPAIEGDQGGNARGGRVGYFSGGPVRFGGLDERYSMPPFATNAGYWAPPQASPRPILGRDGSPVGYYARGGRIGHYARGGEIDPDAALRAVIENEVKRASGVFSPPPAVTMDPTSSVFGSDNGGTGVAVGVAGDNGGISGIGGVYRRGGHLKFAAGGVAPLVKSTRAANDKFVAGARAKAKKPAAGVTRQLALPAASGYFS